MKRFGLVIISLVFLSSTIFATTPHHADLSWNASVSSGVTGYNVYRGSIAGGESGTPVNSALITGTTFSDTGVLATQTYFYVVKAFCPTCSPNLSGPSNEVSATVPADPQPAPPTGVTLTAQ